MDERLRFVARLREGEKMVAMCRASGVARKTGYKIFARYKDCGLEGRTDRSRRPYRQANPLRFQIERPSFSSSGSARTGVRLRSARSYGLLSGALH